MTGSPRAIWGGFWESRNDGFLDNTRRCWAVPWVASAWVLRRQRGDGAWDSRAEEAGGPAAWGWSSLPPPPPPQFQPGLRLSGASMPDAGRDLK